MAALLQCALISHQNYITFSRHGNPPWVILIVTEFTFLGEAIKVNKDHRQQNEIDLTFYWDESAGSVVHRQTSYRFQGKVADHEHGKETRWYRILND